MGILIIRFFCTLKFVSQAFNGMAFKNDCASYAISMGEKLKWGKLGSHWVGRCFATLICSVGGVKMFIFLISIPVSFTHLKMVSEFGLNEPDVYTSKKKF